MTKASPQPRGLLSNYTKLPLVSESGLKKLQALCGFRYLDLLLHLPSNIVDRTHISTLADAPLDTPVTLEISIIEHGNRPRRRRQPFKISAQDETDMVELIFFNYASWIPKAFPAGEKVIVHGTIKNAKGAKQMMHPQVFGRTKSIEDVASITPIYPSTSGLGQHTIRAAVMHCLKLLKEKPVPEWLPADVLEKYDLPSFSEALEVAHNPTCKEDLEPKHPARVRLALDELYANQFALMKAREQQQWLPGIAHSEAQEICDKFIKNLPFEMTGDQQKVLEEIHADLSTAQPMRRLVQGDVGSGKTVVALAALARIVAGGRQGALLAPTEILAEQHFANAQKFLQPLGISCALLTGRLKAAQKKKIKESLADGHIQVIIGTHAILQDSVKIPALGLVIIDEQHRFGVRQRMQLNKDGQQPDLLAMTATPIPRTLALTLYGDLDVSQIREKPPGRKPIQTNAMAMSKLGNITAGLKRVLESGEQVYWVCPLVEENEELDLTSATERFDYLKQHYNSSVGLLHGKMKSDEKEAVLEQFRSGEISILVATTVVEVGVDVSQATTMVIEHAERFGLSQLHQLRGRVGRGGDQSYCILLYATPMSHYASERITAMRESDDGFYLAEQDLKLRGPGEVLGTAQAGAWRTRLADLTAHQDLIPLARDLAEKTIHSKLNKQQITALRGLLKLFHKEAGAELLAAG